MSNANRLFACGLALLTGMLQAEEREHVFSGPQVGERLVKFKARGVLGELAGEELDLVTKADGKPIVLIFVHELTRPSGAVTRTVMDYAIKNSKSGLTSGVIFLSDDATATEERIKRASHALPKVPVGISVDGGEGPGAYGLNRKMTLTVLVGNENKVTANFAIVQPSLQADAPKIGRAIALTLGKDEAPTLEQMGAGRQYAGSNPRMKQDENLAPLLRAVIQKTATEQQVEKAAAAVAAYIAKNEEARKQVAEIANQIIKAGKLGNYGTPKAQEYLTKWAHNPAPVSPSAEWKKHVVYEGASCATAVAGEFSGDKLPDVICNAGGKTRLLVAPSWEEVIISGEENLGMIHSEAMDVDDDGDMDFIGTSYQPGLIQWLEQPKDPLKQRWQARLIDDQVNGIHGLLIGDVDVDGKTDLLANSAQPDGPFAQSLVWYRVPKDVRSAKNWDRFVFAKGDAPGLSHYLGVGDVNGDGRPDAASAAKGGPQDTSGKGNWFAWWEAPEDPTQSWTKHIIADDQPGATNIHPTDVNGDDKMDFIASRGHDKGVVWFEAPDWKEHVIHETLFGPHCLLVTDLDGDGDIDAATCAKDDKLAVWFENDGKGKFASHIVGRDQAAYDIRAYDMDLDGDLDLLVAGQQSANVVWYENPLK